MAENWKARATKAEALANDLQIMHDEAWAQMRHLEMEVRVLQDRLKAERMEGSPFKVGDFVEHHLIGRVTEIQSWGVTVETVDKLAVFDKELILWSIDHDATDWHVI